MGLFSKLKTKKRIETCRSGAIGLEFARQAMHLVQLDRQAGGTLTPRAVASVPYPGSREEFLGEPKQFKTCLRETLRSRGFSGKRVVTCLPSDDIRIMSVTYDVAQGQTDTQGLLQVLEARVEGDLNDYVVDYLPVRTHTSPKERLAVVALARRAQVFALLERLNKAGLEVDALDIGPAAVKRMVGQLLDAEAVSENERDKNVLVLNFGRERSYLTLLSGNRLLMDREVDFGEDRLLENLSLALEMSSAAAQALMIRVGLNARFDQSADVELSNTGIEASHALLEILKPSFLSLVRDIEAALMYAASETHGDSVECIYLVGSVARWRGADRVLQAMVEIPVETVWDPLGSLRGANVDAAAPHEPQPELVMATGLALRGLVDDV